MDSRAARAWCPSVKPSTWLVPRADPTGSAILGHSAKDHWMPAPPPTCPQTALQLSRSPTLPIWGKCINSNTASLGEQRARCRSVLNAAGLRDTSLFRKKHLWRRQSLLWGGEQDVLSWARAENGGVQGVQDEGRLHLPASGFARLTLEGRGHEAKGGGKAACLVPGGSILPPSAIVSCGCQLGPYRVSVRVTRVTL